MDMEMVERVARALAGDQANYAVVYSGPATDGGLACYSPGWKAYEARAIDAIRAMKEPTADMLAAGMGAHLREDLQQTWAEMIDAALTTTSSDYPLDHP